MLKLPWRILALSAPLVILIFHFVSCCFYRWLQQAWTVESECLSADSAAIFASKPNDADHWRYIGTVHTSTHSFCLASLFSNFQILHVRRGQLELAWLTRSRLELLAAEDSIVRIHVYCTSAGNVAFRASYFQSRKLFTKTILTFWFILTLTLVQGHSKSNRLVPGLCPTIP